MKTQTDIAFQTESSTPTNASRIQESGLSKAAIGALLLLLSGTAPLSTTNWSEVTPTAKVILRPEELQRTRRRFRSAIESSLDRLKEFGAYENDWDSSGAMAPQREAINAALQYLTNLQPWHPSPLATLTREGEPVLEFDDGDCFSSMRFRSEPGQGVIVELYTRPSKDGPSQYDEGVIGAPNVNRFALEKMKLPTP